VGLAPRLAGFVLICVMALGSVAMWLGVPYGWLWVASHVADRQGHLTLGPVMIIVICIPVSMVLCAVLLTRLNDLYYRVTGHELEEGPRQAPWMRSMRGERAPKRTRTVLDVVMVLSVLLALISFELWYVLFAGSPLPGGGPLPGPG
jgi:hypothetical protein